MFKVCPERPDRLVLQCNYNFILVTSYPRCLSHNLRSKAFCLFFVKVFAFVFFSLFFSFFFQASIVTIDRSGVASVMSLDR